MLRCLSVVGSLVLASLVIAQDAAKQVPPMMRLDFNDVAMIELARADDTSITIERSRANRASGVPVTRMRTEQRTRTTTVNGKQVQQTYTVSVPYTEVVTQSVTTKAPVDDKPRTFSIAKISAWYSNGQRVADEALADSLRVPVAAILLKSPWLEGVTIEPSHRALIREDTLFLHVSELNPVRQNVRANRTLGR